MKTRLPLCRSALHIVALTWVLTSPTRALADEGDGKERVVKLQPIRQEQGPYKPTLFVYRHEISTELLNQQQDWPHAKADLNPKTFSVYTADETDKRFVEQKEFAAQTKLLRDNLAAAKRELIAAVDGLSNRDLAADVVQRQREQIRTEVRAQVKSEMDRMREEIRMLSEKLEKLSAKVSEVPVRP